jgi:hypothetical protein
MFNKIKYINILVTPVLLGIIFIFLLADAPAIGGEPDVVSIISPEKDSRNKTFLMEGKMYVKKFKNNYFEREVVAYNYNVYDIKVKYVYAGITNEVSAKGTGYHFSAWIDLSSIPVNTVISYSFYGQYAVNKTDTGDFILEDAFSTIVGN